MHVTNFKCKSNGSAKSELVKQHTVGTSVCRRHLSKIRLCVKTYSLKISDIGFARNALSKILTMFRRMSDCRYEKILQRFDRLCQS